MRAANVLVCIGLSALCSAQLDIPGVGLALLAEVRGKYIGTATEESNINNATEWGRAYGEIATSNEFSSWTNENMLKWETTEPEPGVFNFEPAEKLFTLAKEYGKKMRGHTLVWHSQLPPWIEASNFTAAELHAVLERHIKTQVSHFKGRVYAWDVVNEAFEEDGTFRLTIFYNVLGESYIEDVFRWAHEADPDTQLGLNDFNFESITPKTDAAYALIKNLKDKGVPIHFVGAQAHLVVGEVPTDIKETLQRFASLGIDVAITEVDIRVLLPETSEKLKQQQEDFYTVTKACVDLDACVGITFWGISDRLSWIPHVFPEGDFGLAWDNDLKKKPAYYGIQQALLDL